MKWTDDDDDGRRRRRRCGINVWSDLYVSLLRILNDIYADDVANVRYADDIFMGFLVFGIGEIRVSL